MTNLGSIVARGLRSTGGHISSPLDAEHGKSPTDRKALSGYPPPLYRPELVLILVNRASMPHGHDQHDQPLLL